MFHDERNVNYCVICPSAVFHRDKHAEMVVKALKGKGVHGAKVNCRHDIVVDQTDEVTGDKKTFKVSGSAYKLTRKRSLHHGTCLLNVSDLKSISFALRSPAKPFIKTRGVESVSSPITNVGISNEDFEKGVVEQFQQLYGGSDPVIVGEAEGEVPQIEKGVEELTSEEWIYGQTPQFSFSTVLSPEMIAEASKEGKELPVELLAFPEGVSSCALASFQ